MLIEKQNKTKQNKKNTHTDEPKLDLEILFQFQHFFLNNYFTVKNCPYRFFLTHGIDFQSWGQFHKQVFTHTSISMDTHCTVVNSLLINYTITNFLHMSRQHSCRDMYKNFVVIVESQMRMRVKLNFPRIWVFGVKIFSEMSPRLQPQLQLISVS